MTFRKRGWDFVVFVLVTVGAVVCQFRICRHIYIYIYDHDIFVVVAVLYAVLLLLRVVVTPLLRWRGGYTVPHEAG